MAAHRFVVFQTCTYQRSSSRGSGGSGAISHFVRARPIRVIDLWCWHNPSDGPFFFFIFLLFFLFYYFEVTERQLAARPTQRRIMKKNQQQHKKQRQRASSSNDAAAGLLCHSVLLFLLSWMESFSFSFYLLCILSYNVLYSLYSISQSICMLSAFYVLRRSVVVVVG